MVWTQENKERETRINYLSSRDFQGHIKISGKDSEFLSAWFGSAAKHHIKT